MPQDATNLDNGSHINTTYNVFGADIKNTPVQSEFYRQQQQLQHTIEVLECRFWINAPEAS